ncbi:hypothetical protein [Halovivax limisalsi]|uniref:hypothetical protein n=1 Tax=Halovivax limisalsi TaxID=1453760 RepID=UPI001FFD9220|nr:hypothetical protein [Halovivax limisalsi]
MNGTDVARTIALYAAGGTAATLFVAAGVASLLEGMAHGGSVGETYRLQGTGVVYTFVGWVIFVVLAVNVYGAATRRRSVDE